MTKAIVILIVAALGYLAWRPHDEGSMVSAEEYRDLSRCWTSGKANIAFLVVRKSEGKSFPYLISPICDITVEGYPPNSGFLAYLNALPLDGDNGKLKSLGYLANPLESNTEVHTPLPVGAENVYTLRGKLVRNNNDGYIYYSLGDVYEFQDTHLKLSQLRSYPVGERANIFRLGHAPR